MDTVRVLHVDDDPSFGELVTELLERETGRLEVVPETRARGALDRVRDGESDIDCIVSDYEMPEMDGLAFLDAVRQEHPDLPFILFTGKGSEEVASEAIANGATDYLQKSGGTEQFDLLANRIENAVGRYRTQQEHERVYQALETATQGIGILDADGSYIYVNEAYGDLYNGEPGEIRDSHWEQLYPDDEVERFQAEILPALEKQGSWTGRSTGKRADGSTFTQQLWLTQLDTGGHVCVVQDLSERLQRERERQREERRYRAVFEDPNILVGLLDVDGTLKHANRTALELIDHDREAVLDQPFWTTPWWNHDEELQTDLQNWIERAATGEYVEFQAENWTADGEPIYVDGTVRPVTNEDETVVSLIVSARDITEQRKQEQQLREQNRKIRALHRVAADIEVCDTPDEVYSTVVDAAEDILQLDIGIADAAVGDRLVPRAVSSNLSVDQYFEETPTDTENSLAAEAYRTGESSLIEDIRQHDISPAASEFRSVLTVPIGEHGIFQTVDRKVGAFDETDRELTELLVSRAEARLDQLDTEQQLRERTDRLQQQNDRLKEFTSVVSHDLRNPLNLATTSLELVKSECDSDHIEKVESGHEQMETLIDELLTMAREGEPADEFATVDLDSLSRDCWQAVATNQATLETDLDCRLTAQRSRLRQLLTNLMRNAVEHGSPSPDSDARQDAGSEASEDATEHGGDDVTVTVGELSDGFYVEDDGPGIPEDERDRVFESGYTTDEDGTGFGLSIVAEVAEAHGWTVDITEGTDGGARFEIRGVT
jgi:PAS domain S-box-containing protein